MTIQDLENQHDIKPWYKQGWPWFIIAFPAAAVIGGIITIIIATKNSDTLVVTDYYKEGLAINENISRQKKAATLGIHAIFIYRNGQLSVSIDSEQPFINSALDVKLWHPTKEEWDQTLTLIPEGNNRFSAELGSVSQAHWHIKLTPKSNEWELVGRWNLPEKNRLEIKAR